MGKPLGAFLCLLLAAPLGGIGALAAWSTAKTFWDAQRARDWVRVRVDVVPGQFDAKPRGPGSGHFAYALDGRRFEGRRLALGGLGRNDDIDAWRAEMAEDLQAAKAAGRSVSLWVNPDDPAESVLDRSIPWHQPILLGLLALGFIPAGIGMLRSALSIAWGDVSNGPATNAGGGAVFLWVFAVIWNTMAFGMAWLVLADILESREWAGLFVLLFPAVGIFLVWGAATSTAYAIKARLGATSGRAHRPASPAPAPSARDPARPAGAFAAKAARAMFDPPRSPSRPAPGPVELPTWVAKSSVEGGILTVRFSRMRRLALALITLAIGAILAIIGATLLAENGFGAIPVLVLAAGTGIDIAAFAMMGGSLVVRVRPGEIVVEKGGLLRSRTWTLRQDSIRAVVPATAYSVNDEPYFSIHAETSANERVVLGDSIKGAELAHSYARWILSSAGFPVSLVRATPDGAATDS